jgi:hypothetical protein
MWVCSNHIKKALGILETPHIQKAPTGIKCSMCDEQAVVNFYYAHKPFQLKKRPVRGLHETFQQRTS